MALYLCTQKIDLAEKNKKIEHSQRKQNVRSSLFLDRQLWPSLKARFEDKPRPLRIGFKRCPPRSKQSAQRNGLTLSISLATALEAVFASETIA
ncbi:hypothetical protein ACFQHW_12265, partial [Lapidilactobacillus achengensis]